MPKPGADGEGYWDECLTADVLIALAAEKLPVEERVSAKAHLQWCVTCQEELEELRQFLAQDIITELADIYHNEELGKQEVQQRFLDTLVSSDMTVAETYS